MGFGVSGPRVKLQFEGYRSSGLEGFRPYLEGRGDLVSRFIGGPSGVTI